MSRNRRPTTNRPKKKDPAFKISDAGALGRDILVDIAKGVEDLVAVSGRIYVEINLKIEDENLFKDDEVRNSKLIVEVDLGRKKVIDTES